MQRSGIRESLLLRNRSRNPGVVAEEPRFPAISAHLAR